MVSALESGASVPSSSPGRVHCVMLLGKTLYSHSASLQPGAGSFLKGEINYTRYNSYSRDKSAILGITIPGIKMGSRKHYLSLE